MVTRKCLSEESFGRTKCRLAKCFGWKKFVGNFFGSEKNFGRKILSAGIFVCMRTCFIGQKKNWPEHVLVRFFWGLETIPTTISGM